MIVRYLDLWIQGAESCLYILRLTGTVIMGQSLSLKEMLLKSYPGKMTCFLKHNLIVDWNIWRLLKMSLSLILLISYVQQMLQRKILLVHLLKSVPKNCLFQKTLILKFQYNDYNLNLLVLHSNQVVGILLKFPEN